MTSRFTQVEYQVPTRSTQRISAFGCSTLTVTQVVDEVNRLCRKYDDTFRLAWGLNSDSFNTVMTTLKQLPLKPGSILVVDTVRLFLKICNAYGSNIIPNTVTVIIVDSPPRLAALPALHALDYYQDSPWLFLNNQTLHLSFL